MRLIFLIQKNIKFLLLILGLSLVQTGLSQTNLVAELTGNPLNTTGWQIVSAGGGGYVNGDSFVFTNDFISQKGAIYYNQPFNLNQCKKWRIEYEARLWGNGTWDYGNGDGIAFWYLENPPINFTDGGGLGMPGISKGIIVAFDTFDNPTEGQQSEIQVFYGELNTSGYEGNTYGMYYLNTIPLGVHVRNANFQPVVIEWDNGNISISINGIELWNFSPTPYNGVENLSSGYFGFSGSSGLASDGQSIRNVRVFMDFVQLNVNNPVPMEACDIEGDGQATFDLTIPVVDETIIDNPGNYTINYYSSILNMNNNIPIPNPTNYISGTSTVYIKVQNSEDCFQVAELQLIVNSLPVQGIMDNPKLFCTDNSSNLVVDLTTYQDEYMPGGSLGVDFHYYEDAGLTIPIPASQWTNYVITSFPHSVWINASRDFTSETCTAVAQEIIFDLKADLPVNGSNFTLPNSIFCFDETEAFMVDLTVFEPTNTITNETANYIYYTTLALAELGGTTNSIPNPSNYTVTTTGTHSVFVRLENEDYCVSIVEINFEIATNPTFEEILHPIEKCDDNFDGMVAFELNLEVIPLLNSNGTLFTFYGSEADAQNEVNPLGSTLINLPNGTTEEYWVVISNGTCKILTSFILVANSGIDAVNSQESLVPKMICDENFDGSITVNLQEWETELIASTTGISLAYYPSQTDAEQGINPILNWNNYPITQPTTTIWIVLTNEDGCQELRFVQYELGEELPTTDDVFDLPLICLVEENTIDLTQNQNDYTNETGITYTYYLTLADAQAGGTNSIGNPTNFPVNSAGSVFVRLEKEGFCPNIVEVRYDLGDEVPHNLPSNLDGVCAGETLDLTSIEAQISTDPSVNFRYFGSQTDAENQTNEIINVGAYSPSGSSGTLYVRVEQEGFCSVILGFGYEVYPLPTNPISEVPTLCPGTEMILDGGNSYPNAIYEWTWEGGNFIGSELMINSPGTYELAITTEENCQASFVYEVLQPLPPIITNIVMGDNYLIVQTAGNGTQLEFSLDGVFWQSNPRFDNLIPGQDYTIYVRERGCTPISKLVSLPFIPNFLSPNNDGRNDTLAIRGFDNCFDCNVKIFDRYGKIFVDSKPQTSGIFIWDGKYKGDPVPSGDYWYIITTKDETSVEMKYVGHLSVRNR